MRGSIIGQTDHKIKKKQIDGIYLLNDVEFSDSGMIVRRQSNLGCGKKLKIKDVPIDVHFDGYIIQSKDTCIKISSNLLSNQCKPMVQNIIMEKKTNCPKKVSKEKEVEGPVTEEPALFYCTKDENCEKHS